MGGTGHGPARNGGHRRTRPGAWPGPRAGEEGPTAGQGGPTRPQGGPPRPRGAGPKARTRIGQDPLAKAAEELPDGAGLDAGSYHYAFRIAATESQAGPLAAAYYPSRLGTGAPVVLLVHERDRSAKDFEEPIADLKNFGLAEHLQAQGYAVVAVDLRGHGANRRRTLTARDWQAMSDDLQAVYKFMIGRHNYGEFNIARLGVVGLGEGANVALAWAGLGGGVPGEGMASDLNAMVAVSPMVDAQSQGLPALARLRTLAARVPICVLAGERDQSSIEVVKAAQPYLTRVRTNTVKLYPSSLHGYKLLRLEPKLTEALVQFLDSTIKARATEWEGRYNWTPVGFESVQVVRNTGGRNANGATTKDAAAKDATTKDATTKDEPAPAAKPAEPKSLSKKRGGR